jgi:hypothetical protein
MFKRVLAMVVAVVMMISVVVVVPIVSAEDNTVEVIRDFGMWSSMSTDRVVTMSVIKADPTNFERLDRMLYDSNDNIVYDRVSNANFQISGYPIYDEETSTSITVTAITLNRSYLQSLPKGTHYFEAEFWLDENGDVKEFSERIKLEITESMSGDGDIWSFDHASGTLTLMGGIGSSPVDGQDVKVIIIKEGFWTGKSGTFEGYQNLTEINVESHEYYSSLDGVLFNKDKTTLVKYPNGRKDSSYIIPDSVALVGGFRDCTNLKNITVSVNATSIWGGEFQGCSNLNSITFKSATPPIFDVLSTGSYVNGEFIGYEFHDMFSHYDENGTALNTVTKPTVIYVPKGSKSAYETVEYSRRYVHEEINVLPFETVVFRGISIVESCFASCGDCETCNHTCTNKCICTICICSCKNKACHDCGTCATCKPNTITLPADPCKTCDLCKKLTANPNAPRFGRILGKEAHPTIFDALEVLKKLVGMESAVDKCGNALYASLIVETRPTPKTPTIFDALEILKHLVGMTVLS